MVGDFIQDDNLNTSHWDLPTLSLNNLASRVKMIGCLARRLGSSEI